MIIKINGTPSFIDVVEQAAKQNHDTFHDVVTITKDNVTDLVTMCVDGSCTQITQQNLDFLEILLTKFQHHYIEIIQQLIGGITG